ncbi:cell division protein ZapA [Sandaracinobacter sp. RS1-74]|uniref:cell division protein ZapA n=1 Tax=Sandaracinobacteroides sayramensis TaxID=2913411 RepID=UPI001EDA2045|nr:cell division protein ZapA [Sandaracinobacteroides sayramensis]MCG2842411.1 cell division protein ZapA [Sandaracinobacteroides sayramensis]
MAEVSLTIGGRAYRLACRDGEEADLRAAAGLLESRVASLMQAHGAVAEPRLLLMAGLLLSGELLEERANAQRLNPGLKPVPASDAASFDIQGLEALARRAEALALRLEEAATTA